MKKKEQLIVIMIVNYMTCTGMCIIALIKQNIAVGTFGIFLLLATSLVRYLGKSEIHVSNYKNIGKSEVNSNKPSFNLSNYFEKLSNRFINWLNS